VTKAISHGDKHNWGWNDPFRSLPSHEDIIAAVSQKAGDRCPRGPERTGWPDLVTNTHIYEIKVVLTSSAVQRGVGQLLLYGLDWPGRKLVLVGYKHGGIRLKPYVEKLGIEMEILKEPTRLIVSSMLRGRYP